MKNNLIFFICCLLLVACKNKIVQEQVEKDVFYTCSMHPQIMEPAPGNCPICGMQLISVPKTKGLSEDEIILSDQQIQLGNIKLDTIRKALLGDKIILTATLNIDPMQSASLSTRVMGRIEKLYFKSIGDYVRKGDKVLDLYSEELNNAKQEYLLALERMAAFESNTMIDFKLLLEGAKNKLLLWGLSNAQIAELEKTKKSASTTTIYSNVNGFITSLDVTEGDYVMEGGTLFKVANLSSLWAEAQVYASQMAQVDKGAIAEISFPGMEVKDAFGKIEFANPEISPDTRINLMRIRIANPGNKLKPGMPAYVVIKNVQHNMLSLPADAVIRDGRSATIWIKTAENTFKKKMVTTGMESEDRIEIRSGVEEGDAVVINGAYLLNSEYIFKRGASPMADHKM